MIKSKIINLEEKVSCLPGYENFDTKSIAKRMPRRRYVKTITELRFEKEKQYGKIISINNV